MPTGMANAETSFTCERATGHPEPGPWTWIQVPEPPSIKGIGGLAAELHLDVELPHAIATQHGRWIEYGIVEHTYAHNCPNDFAVIVEHFGHRAITPSKYTASSFIARALGDLSRTGHVLYHPGYATGRWAYNSDISWWAVAPAPNWKDRLSWADATLAFDYVPGSTESAVGAQGDAID
jgi:hypothetical protein